MELSKELINIIISWTIWSIWAIMIFISRRKDWSKFKLLLLIQYITFGFFMWFIFWSLVPKENDNLFCFFSALGWTLCIDILDVIKEDWKNIIKKILNTLVDTILQKINSIIIKNGKNKQK